MRPTPRLLLLAAFLLSCAHPTESVLDRYVRASGGAAWDRVHGVRSTGTATMSGMSGTIDTIQDIDSARSRTVLDLGAMKIAQGFDGKDSWEQAPGGEVAIPDDPQTRADVVTEAWLGRRDFGAGGGAAITDLGARDGRHGIRAVPTGGTPIELWFDDASGLLIQTVEPHGTQTVTTTFDDYRAVGDVQMAYHQVIDSGDPRNLVTITYTTIALEDHIDASAFARPETDAERLSFLGGVTTTDIGFELINHHIYIDAEVDDHPVRMLVDTGGLNVLTNQAAERLGLPVEGKMAGGGVGKDKVDVGIAHGTSLEVGAVHLDAPVFYVFDFGNLAAVEGEPFDGIVGFEIFARLAVRIDYPRSVLTLSTPATFTPPAGAIAVPFELRDRIPVIDGKVDGVAARFTIDTGARNSLTLTSPFVAAHDLMKTYRPKFETVTGWGIGGEQLGSPVRFAEIDLGDAKVTDAVGDLFTGDKGAMADPDSSGNIGGGVLSRFVVTFDYAGHTMYLEPASPAPPRDVYDRAGMFFLADGDALKVVAIAAGGAAEKAKLQVGDRILKIDGTAVTDRHLHDWRAVFSGAVGEKHQLQLERAAKVTLVLAELVP